MMPAREMMMTKLGKESPTISRREKFRQLCMAMLFRVSVRTSGGRDEWNNQAEGAGV